MIGVLIKRGNLDANTGITWCKGEDIDQRDEETKEC